MTARSKRPAVAFVRRMRAASLVTSLMLSLAAAAPAAAQPTEPGAPVQRPNKAEPGPAQAPASPPVPAPEAAPSAKPATEAASPPKTPTPPPAKEAEAKPSAASESICLMIESAATTHGLPLDFFVRVIWRESSFRPDAVSPAGAQGIAQFMPRTAAGRGLLDPFDPVQALPQAAQFLQELSRQFGNLGLAAAAYNAGPRRVQDWLAGRGSLPGETQNYVQAITGRSAEDWAAAGRDAGGPKHDPGTAPQSTCRQLVALLKRPPNPFLRELQRRVIAGAASPWGVQLSAGFSRTKALLAYANIQTRFRAILSGRDPMILRIKLRSRGTQDFYQVRVGADTRQSADKLCDSLRAVGGACIVLRN